MKIFNLKNIFFFLKFNLFILKYFNQSDPSIAAKSYTITSKTEYT